MAPHGASLRNPATGPAGESTPQVPWHLAAMAAAAQHRTAASAQPQLVVGLYSVASLPRRLEPEHRVWTVLPARARVHRAALVLPERHANVRREHAASRADSRRLTTPKSESDPSAFASYANHGRSAAFGGERQLTGIRCRERAYYCVPGFRFLAPQRGYLALGLRPAFSALSASLRVVSHIRNGGTQGRPVPP